MRRVAVVCIYQQTADDRPRAEQEHVVAKSGFEIAVSDMCEHARHSAGRTVKSREHLERAGYAKTCQGDENKVNQADRENDREMQ